MTKELVTRSGDPARPDDPAASPGRAAPGPAAGGRRRKRLVTALVALAVGVVALDLASKQLALARLGGGERVELVGDLLSLRLVHNPGAAFSFASGTTWVFTAVAIVVVVVILRVSRRLGSPGWAVAFGLLLGGATGNLLDRLFRPPGVGVGHVVDFIDYAGFFVGNVADIAIVAAAGLIMLLTLRGRGVDGRDHAAVPSDSADPSDGAGPSGAPGPSDGAGPSDAAGRSGA